MPALQLPFDPPVDLLQRRPDWQKRLGLFVYGWQRSPSRRAGHVDFAVDAIEAVTGTRLAVDVPIDDPVTWATALFGPAIDPKRSRPGDLVTFDLAEGELIAVRAGDLALYPLTAIRLSYVPPRGWKAAFAIGRESDECPR